MNNCGAVEKHACTKCDNRLCKGCFDKLSKMEESHYMSSIDARDTKEEGGSKGMGFHIGLTDTTNKGCDEDIMKNYDRSSIGFNEYYKLDEDLLDDEYDEENEFLSFEMGADTTEKQHSVGACDEQDYFSDIHSESSVDSNICVYDDERDTINLKK